MQRCVDVILNDVDDPLKRQVFTFTYLEGRGAMLDRWAAERRATTRHAWRAEQWQGEVWTRLMHRYNKIGRPDVPPHVAAKALEEFAATLRFADGELDL